MRLITKNDWKQVNDDNKDFLEDYKLEMESRGLSKGSVYQYCADIKGFFCWLVRHRHNEYILKSKKRTFRNFFLMMRKAKCSSNRINRMESSLRNLLQFACDDEEEYSDYVQNVMSKIKGMPKKPVRKIVFLTDKQITMLINYLCEHHDYEKALYVSLSYDSAGRRNEIRGVNKDGFLENKETNAVKGKESKVFHLLKFARTNLIARKYLAQRGKDDCPALFATKQDGTINRASTATFYHWVRRFRIILHNLTKKPLKDLQFNCHSFRHSALENYSNGTHYFLRHTGKKALPIGILKGVAHHQSSDTTRKYLKNRDKEKVDKVFGL